MSERATPEDEVYRTLQRERPDRPRIVQHFAPGRLNLLGAHLDYNGGQVLPVSLQLGIHAAVALRNDGEIRMLSLDRGERLRTTVADVGAVAAAEDHWGAFALGVWRELGEAGAGALPGFDLVVGGDLPMESGLSSSAALEVATAMGLSRICGIELAPVELARLAHRAENSYVGVRCGIMDQFASALGKAGQAILLRCDDESWDYVPLPVEQMELLLIDTRKPRDLLHSSFNARVEECAQARDFLEEHCGGPRKPLAAYSRRELEAAAPGMDPTLLRRARHVVHEMERMEQGVASLVRGDLAGLGEQLKASHRSTSLDYEVSCPELDRLAEWSSAVPHVFGCRLTGAGFGGCLVVLSAPGSRAAIVDAVKERFAAEFGVEPGFLSVQPGSGPRLVVDQ